MSMIRIDLIAGTRPNFMKIAPIIDALRAAQACGSHLDYRLIHTGQHYDRSMSGGFFEQLGIPEPDLNLEVGSGTQAEQTANIMVRYEWARHGQQPEVKTSGKRKGYKVFGAIEYFSGCLFYQGIEGRFNSESYQGFLQRIMEQTTQPLFLIHDEARYHTSAAT